MSDNNRKEYFIGISIGGSPNEKTGMVISERSTRDGKYFHSVVKTERFPLGSTFEDIAERAYNSYTRLKEEGHYCEVVLDITSVGAQVRDLFNKKFRVDHELFLIHGLMAHRDEKRYCRQYIPKTDILGALQLVYQGKRLEIAGGLQDSETLARQWDSDKPFWKPGKGRPGADMDPIEREGPDDDLIIAFGVAMWAAEQPPVQYVF